MVGAAVVLRYPLAQPLATYQPSTFARPGPGRCSAASWTSDDNMLCRTAIGVPTRIEKYTVLSGPNIDKEARQQFEIRTHKRLIDIVQATAKTIEALNKLSLPAGVDIKIKASAR